MIVLTACSDQSALTSPSRPAIAPAPPTATVSSPQRPDEERFVELSKSIPSFGGYYLDRGGNVVTYVADEANFARGRSVMSDRLRSRSLGIPLTDRVRGIIVRKGQYSFLQLSRWRDSVYTHLLGTGGVLFDDLDEAINRVTIGLDESAFEQERTELLPRLQALGIPQEAVHIEPTGRIVARAGRKAASPGAALLTASTNLIFMADTLAGGFLITPYGCTIGIVGDSANVRVFVTASHCSSSVYHVDGTRYQQGDGRYVGAESADPLSNSQYCSFINGGYHCYPGRGSDANLVRIFAGIPSRRGVIARPSTRVSGGAGPTDLDQARPWIYVTSTENGHPVGTTVDKIGYSSGWTYGTILNSCTDEWVNGPGLNPDYSVRCSIRTSIYSLGGDSGSPIFVWDGQDVAKFMGILWGGVTGNDNVTFYAGYRALEADLGILDRGVLNVKSDLSLTPVTLSSFFDPPAVILSWSGGRGVGMYGTTYTLSRTDYSVDYDREWGWPYFVQGWSGVLYTSPYAESYRDESPWGNTETPCPPDPYSVGGYSQYTMTATSMGMTTSTSICLAL